jgi:hypothetical protein
MSSKIEEERRDRRPIASSPSSRAKYSMYERASARRPRPANVQEGARRNFLTPKSPSPQRPEAMPFHWPRATAIPHPFAGQPRSTPPPHKKGRCANSGPEQISDNDDHEDCQPREVRRMRDRHLHFVSTPVQAQAPVVSLATRAATPTETDRIIAMMAPLHLAKVEDAIVAGAVRIDLNGQDVELVTDAHRATAVATKAEISRIRSERRLATPEKRAAFDERTALAGSAHRLVRRLTEGGPHAQ